VVAHHTVDLSAKYGGLLERVHVRLGDTVVSKQKIATLDDASVKHELSRARAALAAARASSRKAAIQAKDAKNRYRRRVKAAGTFSKEVLSTARSQAELARVRRAEAMAGVAQGAATISNLNEKLQSAIIRAPFSGKVAAIYQKPGTNVGAGQPIVRIITANDMWVRFAVPREDLARVKVHGAVTARVKVVGASLEGVIKHVSPEIDPASQMIFVEAQLVVPKTWSGRIPAGATARVSMADK
jgi:RND family efflux transporter MFP subunit